MNQNNFEQRKPVPEIQPNEFHKVNKGISTKDGLRILGAISKLTGTYILVELENGETEVRPLAGNVSAANPAWVKIEKAAKDTTIQLLNIRPEGRYSEKADKGKNSGNM